jgi:hypothetical protein
LDAVHGRPLPRCQHLACRAGGISRSFRGAARRRGETATTARLELWACVVRTHRIGKLRPRVRPKMSWGAPARPRPPGW